MNADPERWAPIQAVFDLALQLDGEARTRLLESHCRVDAELRAEVESLLAAFNEAEQELEVSPIKRTVVPPAESNEAESPTTYAIPGYEIVKEVYRGGQGVVFEALQLGTKRRVALKVILDGPFAGTTNKRRFEREVELTGSLKHPGIVPIFDSGVAFGQYFFAMEFVDGLQLTEYCRQRCLSERESLSLFVKICEAIDYAHQKGVIHRDLKPSNILMDERGEPRIVDFGLAKVKESGDTKQQLLSRSGQLMGTPCYMSPEQAAGDPDAVDMRTDVYSLGVLLFDCLRITCLISVKVALSRLSIRCSSPNQFHPAISIGP